VVAFIRLTASANAEEARRYLAREAIKTDTQNAFVIVGVQGMRTITVHQNFFQQCVDVGKCCALLG
jgi:hypothetical protein